MKTKALTVLFLFVVITSWSGADSATDFKSAVDQAVKEFEAALVTKDADRMGSVYATDAMIFPPNSEVVEGRQAIASFWKTLMDSGMTAKLEVTRTESDGNLGVDIGKYKILGSDGKEVDHGKYVVVWKKEKGAWKIYRDIWNTSAPAPASAESK